MESLQKYLVNFQRRKLEISDSEVLEIAQKGGEIAKKNAQVTIKEVRKAVGMRYI